jgi:hypothetical protein
MAISTDNVRLGSVQSAPVKQTDPAKSDLSRQYQDTQLRTSVTLVDQLPSETWSWSE